MKRLICQLLIPSLSLLLIQSCSTLSPQPVDLTIVNALLYAEPGVSPIDTVNISIDDGKISAIYSGKPIKSDLVIDANGRAVTAGFWNSHVHFTNPKLKKSSEQIISAMLLKYGFTTVIDVGSDLQDTLSLKKNIEEHAHSGPRILMAGGSFVFKDGTPSYLPGVKLPEIGKPSEADSLVAAVLDAGADGIKIFSGSFQLQRDTIHLPPNIIRSITNAAHSRGSFVFSHPTDRTGFINAVNNGVDVLAHTAPQAGPLGADLVAAMKNNDVALIPTLKLWRYELERAGVAREEALEFQSHGTSQLAEYFNVNGEILFGTDVGYMNDFDTTDEFRLMTIAGMGFDDILASLTTIPSRRFSSSSGKVVVGAPADIVILEGDPVLDTTSFSRVAYTIRNGRIVYRSH